MEKSETINQLATALSIAQGKFEAIKRTEKVDFTSEKGRRKYNYAPLEEVVNACRKSLSENGLSILQLTSCITDGMFVLETVLAHKSGEWIKSEMSVTAYPANPQQQGSALTYARRYSLSALLGVASEEDDDGEAGIKKEDETQQTTQKKTPQGTGEQKEHWCDKHNTRFFKTEKMLSYAHPVKNADGTPTLNDKGKPLWCHEHKEPPKAETQADRDIEALYEDGKPKAEPAVPPPSAQWVAQGRSFDGKDTTEPAPGKQPEQDVTAPESMPVSEKRESGKIPLIDIATLKNGLKAAKWTEATCVSWLRSKANYRELNLTGNLESIVNQMNKEQADFLNKEIQSRLEMA